MSPRDSSGLAVAPVGTAGDGHRTVVSVPRRQRRAGMALLAVFVSIVAALVFLLWAGNLGGRSEVVGAARDVSAGDVIARGDLRVVRVAADSDVATVPAAELEGLVGKVAATPLFEGALITEEQVSAGAPLGDDEAIVGVLVKPGQAPLGSLRVGTTVQVVQTADPSGVSASTPEVLSEGATVFAVSEPAPDDASAAGVAGSVLVSLQVPTDASAAIVSAADAERIRLVVVGGVTG
ncbi:MAG: SAF domain-containing protein [Acidimicrobiia bacterium]